MKRIKKSTLFSGPPSILEIRNNYVLDTIFERLKSDSSHRQPESSSETEAESGEGTVFVDNLAVNTVSLDLTVLEEAVVVRLDVLGETELTGDENLLSAGELHLRTTESLLSKGNLLVGGSDGEEHLTDGDTSRLTKGLTEGTSHTLLESISTSAREHLVDADNVPRMDSDSEMEVLSTDVDEHVLVGSNTGSFEGLGGNLLLLVANHMDATGELSVLGLLLTAVVHSNLSVGDTTVETRLRIRLVLLVPVAPRGSSSHYYD